MYKLKRAAGVILEPVPANPWESGAVFNPATIRENEIVHMLYRAVEGENFSTIGYARLDKGGKILDRRDTPLIFREHDYEMHGVEDARITKLGDRYYILYTGFEGEECRVCMASTSDFVKIEKHGIIIPDIWDKDAMFFPNLINGELVLMHRIIPNIQLAFFDDMEHVLKVDSAYWKNHIKNLDSHTIMRSEYWWESKKIGGGAPPIKTKDGWLIIYHGVDNKTVYRAGAALLDLDDPRKVISRLPDPILEPERDYELHGDVPNVVFPEGAVVFDGQLQVYYGCADKVIGLAVADLDELLDELSKHKV
ncbi:MAG: glycosidase [Calditrichaeota bacterium]|nr:MAG: glycosidase [Calditrichota bacterium]